jgi:hypothetical protein
MSGFGANNTKVQVIVPVELHAALEKLASVSDLSVSHYMRRVLNEAVAQNCVYPASSSAVFAPQPKNQEAGATKEQSASRNSWPVGLEIRPRPRKSPAASPPAGSQRAVASVPMQPRAG